MQTLIFLAGLGQLALVLGSLFIPVLLDYKSELNKLNTLFRQIFCTYAIYIFCFNLCFGLLSIFQPGILLDRSLLASFVSSFIAIYWGVRLIIQFIYFDRTSIPKGLIYIFGEIILVISFIFFTSVYALAALSNFGLVKS